jgi:hypothetical protein
MPSFWYLQYHPNAHTRIFELKILLHVPTLKPSGVSLAAVLAIRTQQFRRKLPQSLST